MSFFRKIPVFLCSARRLLQDAFSALFGGERCIRCGQPAAASGLCRACSCHLHAFPPLTAAELPAPFRCRMCGKLLLSEKNICMECRSSPVLQHTDGVFPLHAYRFWKKQLLHEWKSGGRRTLSPLFACMVAEALAELEAHCGARLPLVPVPPRPGKIRRQGWDQIAELCFYVRLQHGRRVLPLLRRQSQLQQKHLGRAGRLQSLSSAYVADAKAVRRLRAKEGLPGQVVLLDDVLTTGATIESCARALKKAGISRVYAITLFSVD